MSEFRNGINAKALAQILRRLADEVEKDGILAEALLEEVKKEKNNAKAKAVDIGNDQPDIFSMYINQGFEGLKVSLEGYSAEDLKTTVRDNGLDPTGKVRRWRSRDRIIAFIIETVHKRVSQGNVFLSENEKG